MRILSLAVVAAMVVGCGGGAAPPAPGAGGAGGTAGSGGSAAGGSGGAPGSGGSGGVAMAPDASPPVADSAPIVDTMAPPAPDTAPALPDTAALQPDTAPLALDTAPPSPDTAPPAATCTPNSPVGCGANQWCSKATGTCLTAMTAMRWTFSHMCPAAGDIEFRMFDDTNGGAFPGGNVIFVLPLGTTRGADINCIAGARICYGAHARSAALFWGADTDGSQPCTDCCAICGGGPVATTSLVCN